MHKLDVTLMLAFFFKVPIRVCGMFSVDEELLEILLEPGMDDGAEEGKTKS